MTDIRSRSCMSLMSTASELDDICSPKRGLTPRHGLLSPTLHGNSATVGDRERLLLLFGCCSVPCSAIRSVPSFPTTLRWYGVRSMQTNTLADLRLRRRLMSLEGVIKNLARCVTALSPFRKALVATPPCQTYVRVCKSM